LQGCFVAEIAQAKATIATHLPGLLFPFNFHSVVELIALHEFSGSSNKL
jgi:hypothetical protein